MRRAPDAEAWRHALDAGDARAHAAAVERRRAAAAPPSLREGRDFRANGRDASFTTAQTSRAPHASLPIWSPAAEDVDPGRLSAEAYEEVLERFQTHWKRGDPVIVTGVRGAGDAFWAPSAPPQRCARRWRAR